VKVTLLSWQAKNLPHRAGWDLDLYSYYSSLQVIFGLQIAIAVVLIVAVFWRLPIEQAASAGAGIEDT
jgi:hypothetical protein